MRKLLLTLAALCMLAAPTFAQTITPQGRLTLTSGMPVMNADTTGAGTIYYDCYNGNVVPVGATPTNLTIPGCEASVALSATNNLAGGIYDIFAIDNTGTLALCIGPAWATPPSSGFGGARGTGAGTTQIDNTNGGLWTNSNSLAHCYNGATDYGSVAAHAATYLGSFYATAAGQTAMQFHPARAAGGTNNFMALYNAYNRVLMLSQSQDSNNWTYAAATWRMADNSVSNRISYLDGLEQSQAVVSYVCGAQPPSGNSASISVIFNGSSAPAGLIGYYYAAANSDHNLYAGNTNMSLGLSYVQAMEAREYGSGTVSFFADTGDGSVRQSLNLFVPM